MAGVKKFLLKHVYYLHLILYFVFILFCFLTTPDSTVSMDVLFCFVLFCFVLFCFVLIWFDLIWFDLIWFDLIWFDLIWFDLIWFVLFCFVLCKTMYVFWNHKAQGRKNKKYLLKHVMVSVKSVHYYWAVTTQSNSGVYKTLSKYFSCCKRMFNGYQGKIFVGLHWTCYLNCFTENSNQSYCLCMFLLLMWHLVHTDSWRSLGHWWAI